MTRVSDLYIELIPPNPLELQVTVTGAYESLTWSRGGTELAGSGSVIFSNFRQTLTISSTSAGDAGEYTVEISVSLSITFQIQVFRESMSGILSCVCMSPSIGIIPSTVYCRQYSRIKLCNLLGHSELLYIFTADIDLHH